jgi:hypothetical protein
MRLSVFSLVFAVFFSFILNISHSEEPVKTTPAGVEDATKPRPLTEAEISAALADPNLFTFIGDKDTRTAVILSPGAIYQWGKYESLRLPNNVGIHYNLAVWKDFQEKNKKRIAVYTSEKSLFVSGRRVSYLKDKPKFDAFVRKNSSKIIVIIDCLTGSPAQKYYMSQN